MQLWPALTTVLALFMYFILALNVGRARGRYGIKAPAVSGNEDFERYYRVQMNTLEHMVIFLPSMWIFAQVWAAPVTASAFGLIWITGRILFAKGYYEVPAKRKPGFFISAFATKFLLIGSFIGIIKGLSGF